VRLEVDVRNGEKETGLQAGKKETMFPTSLMPNISEGKGREKMVV
jgi:hypothetical protein